MSNTHITRKRALRTAAIGLAVASIAAPAASAANRHQAGSTVDLPAIVVRSDGYLNTANPPVLLPDIVVGAGGYLNTANPPVELPDIVVRPDGYLNTATPPVELPDIVVRPGGFLNTANPPSAPQAAPTGETPAAGSGFDWRDAGIGIVIGFLVAAALGIAMQMTRRRTAHSA